MQFLFLSLYLLLIHIIGQSLILSNRYISGLKNLPASMLIGHFFVTSLFASIITSGKTYLIIPFTFLIIITLVSYHKTCLFKTIFTFNYNKLFLFFLCIIIGYSAVYFRIIDFTGNVKKLHADYSFYGGIADFMLKYKTETFILDPLSLNHPYYFYHYFEMWNAALFSMLSKQTGTYSLLLFTYTIHLILTLWAIISFMISIQIKRGTLLILMIGILFSMPLGELYNQLLGLISKSKLTMVNDGSLLQIQGMKLFIVYPILLLLLQMWLNKQVNHKYHHYILLLLLLTMYPTSIPFVVGLIICYEISPYLIKKLNTNQMIGIGLSILILFGIINIRTPVYMVFEFLRYLLAYPLIIVGFVFIKNNQFRFMAMISLIALTLSVGFFQTGNKLFVAFQDPNIFQLIANVSEPLFWLLNVVSFAFLAMLFDSIIIVITTACYIALYFIQGYYSKTFNRSEMNAYILPEIVNLLNSQPNKLITYSRDSSIYTTNTASWSVYFDIPYDNMRFYCNNYFPIPVTPPLPSQINNQTARKSLFYKMTANSSFYHFATENNLPLDSQSAEKFKQTHRITTHLHH